MRPLMGRLDLNVLPDPELTATVFAGTVLMCLGPPSSPSGGYRRSIPPSFSEREVVVSNKVLLAENVVKVFQEGTQRIEVLRGVSLHVRPGEVVALEGPSGSGKTTLLSIMGCILTRPPAASNCGARGAGQGRERAARGASAARSASSSSSTTCSRP